MTTDLAAIRARVEAMRKHAWLARFRGATSTNGGNELSPFSANEIAGYVDAVLDDNAALLTRLADAERERLIGAAWKDARLTMQVGLREWSEKVGALPSQYCNMEHGYIKPDEKFSPLKSLSLGRCRVAAERQAKLDALQEQLAALSSILDAANVERPGNPEAAEHLRQIDARVMSHGSETLSGEHYAQLKRDAAPVQLTPAERVQLVVEDRDHNHRVFETEFAVSESRLRLLEEARTQRDEAIAERDTEKKGRIFAQERAMQLSQTLDQNIAALKVQILKIQEQLPAAHIGVAEYARRLADAEASATAALAERDKLLVQRAENTQDKE